MASEYLNELVDSLLPFAERLLRERGEFLPFGAWTPLDGKIRWVAAEGETEYPGSQALLDILVSNFSKEAAEGKLLATAICLDTRFRPSAEAETTDAICFRLESWAGEALAVYVPYKLQKDPLGKDNIVETGEMSATAMTPQIFSNQLIH
jgi:hypothetical protein